jgi:hypothetical protein
MRVHGIMVRNMEKENTIMDLIIFITENGSTIRNPVKEYISTERVCITELGKIINDMEMEV